MDENMNFEDTVTLDLDGDVQLECGIVAIFEAGDRDYIALLPLEEIDDIKTDELLMYRYDEDEDGNPILDNIETDEELEAVSDAFDELLDDEALNEIMNEEE